MKLVRYTYDNVTRVGKIVGDKVIDLSAIANIGDSMRTLIEHYSAIKSQLEAATSPAVALSAVKLEAPIHDPQKFLAIGMNYQAHADEAAAAGIPIPKNQLWFNKQVSCIAGPTDPIDLPKVSVELDYEAELGFIIGKAGRHVSKADAQSIIFGYLVVNDVSVRDWQHRTPTFTLGKSFDTHGPIGPWITTADEVPDPHKLTLHLSVNGIERQRSSTNDMIYNIFDQISYLTTVMTLVPGDLIATGTPSGVAAVDKNWLKVGDKVRVEVDGLGAIDNLVRAEP